MPQPKDIWIQESTKQFFHLLETAEPSSDSGSTNLLHEDLPTFRIFADVDKALYSALSAIHSDQNRVVLRLESLNANGDVCICAWEWIGEFRGWFRKTVITTTLAACGVRSAKEGTMLRMGSIETNGLRRDNVEDE